MTGICCVRRSPSLFALASFRQSAHAVAHHSLFDLAYWRSLKGPFRSTQDTSPGTVVSLQVWSITLCPSTKSPWCPQLMCLLVSGGRAIRVWA